MLNYLYHWLLAICLVIAPAFSEEVGYVFSDAGDFELSNVTISTPNLTDTVTFTTAGTGGSGGSYVSDKEVGELQSIFDQRVEPRKVANDAIDMVIKSPGDHTIHQVCLIYKTIKESWYYFSDPRGEDYYRFANETLQEGRKNNCIGVGDCDDFALLMASMVEAIGGSTRVMLAYSPTGSHAYAEVYLGKKGSEEVKRLTKWLKLKYDVNEISTHWDKETGDVWLNLDWGKNIAIAAYPGSPFFDATEHIPIYIKVNTTKYPLNPSPMALFVCPQQVNAGEPVNFNASESLSIADADEFEWDFGEGKGKVLGPESNVSYTYAKKGDYNVTLKVIVDQVESSSTSIIYVNDPPRADFTVSPQRPELGDLVTFDSSPSNDSDGQIVERYWELDNRPNSREDTTYKKYPKNGYYWVNLTVTDDKGARRTKSLHLRINEPPVAGFVPDRQDVNVGESTIFDAASSKDPDGGTLVNYTWDFGDGVPAENKSLVRHAFTSGGDKTVSLVVEDSDGAKSTATCLIRVNNPPEAAFTYQIKEGNKVEFNASSSRDEEGKIASYKWDFDDFSAIQEAIRSKIVHTYDEPGQYNITLTVTDDRGSTGSLSQTVDLQPPEPAQPVEPENQPPVASFAISPLSPHIGEPVFFDAAPSWDSDGSIVDYLWDFGDNSESSGSAESHVFNMPGYYHVTLTVTDDKGLKSSSYHDVQVQENTGTGATNPTVEENITAANITVEENVSRSRGEMTGRSLAIHSSGQLEIGQASTADLDAGIVGGGDADDIFFHAVSQSKRYIEPYWNGARITYTSDVSKLGECSSYASKSLDKVSVDQRLVGTYIGVITNEGRCSEIFVRGVDDPRPGIISFEYTTLGQT